MRRKFTAAEKQRFLAELKASGETPWRFAQRVGITPGTLYRWVEKPLASAAPRFARLVTERRARPTTGVTAGRIAVQVGNASVQVEPGFDAVLLRAVVAALSGKAES
jgi:transposase-like protein